VSSDTADDHASCQRHRRSRSWRCVAPTNASAGVQLESGQRAAWNRVTRTVLCLACAEAIVASPPAGPPRGPESGPEPVVEEAAEGEPTPLDTGLAGGSAKAEFDRRHARREARVRGAHPRLGGLILAPSDDPQSTRAWQSGAIGERRLGEKRAGLDDAVICAARSPGAVKPSQYRPRRDRAGRRLRRGRQALQERDGRNPPHRRPVQRGARAAQPRRARQDQARLLHATGSPGILRSVCRPRTASSRSGVLIGSSGRARIVP
jgi:hypothetical protein